MSSQSQTPRSRITLEPSAIGEYISFNSCPQFHKYEFDKPVRVAESNKRDYKEAFEPLNLLLAKDGQDFEDDCEDAIDQYAAELIDHTGIDDWNESADKLETIINDVNNRQPGSPPVAILQPRFGPRVEAWPVYGDADVLFLFPQDDGVLARLIDIKSAYDEKTYQQIQVAVYTILMGDFLEDVGLDDTVTIEGGVWTRETEITGNTPDDFPKYKKLGARESDIRRLLKEGGEFDRWFQADNDDISYQLSPKCYGCSYREACYSNAIDESSLALLGLSRGEQEKFEEHGIGNLDDLAKLAHPEPDPRPYEYDSMKPADKTTYAKLYDESGIGQRLPRYIQKAQSLLSKFNSGNKFARNNKDAPWIMGAGDGTLPEDDPAFEPEGGLGFERRTMIRVYLHVERDHRRDRLSMVSAFVTASKYEDAGFDPIKISELSDSIPDDEQVAQQLEEDLIETFFDRLFDTIREVGDKMGNPTAAPVHLYMYTHQEKDALMDAAKRHDIQQAKTVRDLLGLRNSVGNRNSAETRADQAMVSILQSEIDQRKAPTVPNPGILPMLDEFYPNNSAAFFANSNWQYTRNDGVDVDLRKAFRFKIFDYRVPFKNNQSGTGIELMPGGNSSQQPDGFYPSRIRQGSHIPLEYIWAAQGRLTDEWIEDAKENFSGESVEPFRWLDQDTKDHKIQPEDIKRLGTSFAHCLAHIERGMQYRNSSLVKRSMPLDKLDSFTLGDSSIVRAAKEFLDLEYHTQRNETYQHYSGEPKQRIRSGDAIPMVVEEVERQGSGDLTVKGRLLYEPMFQNGDRVANACRKKGNQGATSGSWMVANELERNGEAAGTGKPYDIEKGVQVAIQSLDLQNGTIEISARQMYSPDPDYSQIHRFPTDDPAKAAEDPKNNVLFEPDKIFILDPQTDDITGQRALNVLNESDNNNYAAQLLQSIADGNTTNPTTNAFDGAAVSEFNDWCKQELTPAPNKLQQDYILEDEAQLSLLQGPPGTGKTSLTLAPAVVSRVYSYAKHDEKFAGVVAGESNKAVDEILDDVADVVEQYRDSGHSDLLENLQLVRLVSEVPDDAHPEVDYINYNTDEEEVKGLIERLRNQDVKRQQTFGDLDDVAREHLLVFATPSRIYGLINKLDRELSDSWQPEDWVKHGASFFDMLAIDEASMMRLPSFLLAGAFCHEHAQFLVAGDQRQMPPVAQHDWENEDRRIIEERIPYLSTLDYLRALGGQEIDTIYEPDEAITADATIPMVQLERTYRCHTLIAQFLQRHMYAQDNIDYSSEEQHTIATPSPGTPALDEALDPDAPLVLVLHDDDTNQQANPEEAVMAASIDAGLDAADDTGIVTPHNAQRGMLGTQLPSGTEIDTVERFQGGQRDTILVSATASDPDFLNAESDFILNPNRLNVAMSRMKKKLIVIASREVFNLVPPEVEKYDRALLWKGLYEDMGVNSRAADWSGSLDEFTPQNMSFSVNYDGSTNVSVYTLGGSL